MADAPSPPARRVRWIGAALLLAAVATILTHELLLTVFVVQGVSMEPTLREGQRVVVWRPTGQLSRGDLVVFMNPVDPRQSLLKRVLALPGERIEAVKGRVYVGDLELGETYVKPGTTAGSFPKVQLGADEYYLVGDNRGASVDSRRFGEIDRRLIVGRVVYTLW